MQRPARPADEALRIDTLRALNIPDASPGERFGHAEADTLMYVRKEQSRKRTGMGNR